jgi:hypothetical protein
MKFILLVACATAACAPRPVISRTSDTGGGGGTQIGGGSGAGGNVPAGGTGGGFSFPAADAGPLMDAPGTGTPSSMANCGLKRIDLSRKPADLLLVLDRSGSMALSFVPAGGTAPVKKWDEVVSAIDATVMKTQGVVNWGLQLYPVGPICNVPDKVTVALAPTNYTAVMTGIRMNQPYIDGGATPTQAAIRKATAVLQADTSMNQKYLVLATDGLPNCSNGASGSDAANDRVGSTMAIAEALTAGFPTFVIGIATGTDAEDTLNDMATAGGRPRMDMSRYYPVASKDQLVAALAAITGQIAACNFPLDPPPPVPDNVAVEVDGARLAKDPTDGWAYTPDGKAVVLNGPSCQHLMDGTARNVAILYGCPDVIIP